MTPAKEEVEVVDVVVDVEAVEVDTESSCQSRSSNKAVMASGSAVSCHSAVAGATRSTGSLGVADANRVSTGSSSSMIAASFSKAASIFLFFSIWSGVNEPGGGGGGVPGPNVSGFDGSSLSSLVLPATWLVGLFYWFPPPDTLD